MGTSHPRIGVTKDPELAAALDVTRDLVGAESEAGQVRRLALLGARALVDGTADARATVDRQRILDRRGVRAASRDLLELPWLKAHPDSERRLSATLEWVRGQR
jgi:hypothetical protein